MTVAEICADVAVASVTALLLVACACCIAYVVAETVWLVRKISKS